MSTYIAGVEAALSSIQKDRQKDIDKALMGFLSLRFTSSSSATISMAHSDDSSPAGARSYLEIYSLTKFYDDLQTYDDIVRPIQEQAVNTFLVYPFFSLYCKTSFSKPIILLRHGIIGVNTWHPSSKRNSIKRRTPSLRRTSQLWERLPTNTIRNIWWRTHSWTRWCLRLRRTHLVKWLIQCICTSLSFYTCLSLGTICNFEPEPWWEHSKWDHCQRFLGLKEENWGWISQRTLLSLDIFRVNGIKAKYNPKLNLV